MEHKYGGNAPEVPEAPNFFYIAVLGIEGKCSIVVQCYCLNSLTLSKGYNGAYAVPQNEQHSYVNETLIHHGLLGTTPVQPGLAISLQTLELYRQCRLRCPQFSIQQWVKVLCDLANVSCSIYFHSVTLSDLDRSTTVKSCRIDSQMHLTSTLISIGNSTKQSRSSSAVIPTHGASTMHAHHVNIRCAHGLYSLFMFTLTISSLGERYHSIPQSWVP